MPSIPDASDKQGGKAYGEYMDKWSAKLDEVNEKYLSDEFFNDDDDLKEKLAAYKAQFIDCDQDYSGDLNMMDVKYMMEKLGQAKTHLEVKKMIKEVDTTDTETINYEDFVAMMLGPKSTVLKLILQFEAFGKPAEKATGVAPKRDLSSLP